MNDNNMILTEAKLHSKNKSMARKIFAAILVIINFIISVFSYHDTLRAADFEFYSREAQLHSDLSLSAASYITGNYIYYDDVYPAPVKDDVWVIYNLLDEADKKVYNLFLDLIDHRGGEEYTNGIVIEKEQLEQIGSNHFWNIYEAVIYDHPEYFYLMSNSGMISCQSLRTANYCVFIYMINAETDEEKVQIDEFNAATDQFMQDIDLSLPAEEIELAIHDKLISLVSYDYDLLEEMQRDRFTRDLGHSAYGALVCNSAGKQNSAVCSGYSAAFQYLCQQAGIPCCTLTGSASYISDESYDSRSNGHTWNCVRIDGNWYEVDVTWDDYEYQEPLDYEFYEALMNDSEKSYNNLHHFYNKTTYEMEYLEATNDTVFLVVGYLPYSTRKDSTHIRHTTMTGRADDQDAFCNQLIPVAG